ncbi:MAG: peptidoglycan-binding protein [Patescibacteria group bacterium]
MKKALLVLAVFSALAIAPVAEACSVLAIDRPLTGSEIIRDKDAAFIGTVTGISQDKSIHGEYRISFTIEESYKGSVDGTVTVRAQSSSAACGYDDGYGSFKVGSVWTIYANGNDTDGYATNSVSSNAKYASVADAKKTLSDLGLSPEDTNPTVCTMQYQPICGKDSSGAVKTYGNSCTLGAAKAEFLYDGECKATASKVPSKDLWRGMRGTDVTWLQDFLVSKATGKAALSLGAVGSTGYFGSLTAAALTEFQKAHGIMPAFGYFGAKTRAFILSTMAPTATFTGTISAVNTGCFADGICSVTIDGKEVILLAGFRIPPIPEVGSLIGVDSISDLESEIGSKGEVYAAPSTEGDAEYTLYGSTSYYVKVMD